MGRFSQVEVFAEEVEGAVALYFVAQALRRLGDIRITGNNAVSSSDLRLALQQRGGDEIDNRTVANMQKRAVRYLHLAATTPQGRSWNRQGVVRYSSRHLVWEAVSSTSHGCR